MVATRSHANFVEHVPWRCSWRAIAGDNGGKQGADGGAGGPMVSRVMHVELGLRCDGTTGIGRAVGWWGTMGTIAYLAGYAGWLVRKYWGF